MGGGSSICIFIMRIRAAGPGVLRFEVGNRAVIGSGLVTIVVCSYYWHNSKVISDVENEIIFLGTWIT